MNRARPTPALLALGAAYAVGLALIVLGPFGGPLNTLTVRLYTWWTYRLHGPFALLPGDFGFALNVLLFVPVGLLLVVVLQQRWWVATAVCVLLSTCVELVQAIPGVDRMPDVSDVVGNGLGGLVGALAAVWLSRARPRTAARGR